MHISDLNQVSKLSSELTAIRAQIAAVEDLGVRVAAGSGAHVDLSQNTLETFQKLALIELAQKEEKVSDQLEELGVDSTKLPPCECETAGFTIPPEAILATLFGLHAGGPVGRRG